MEKDILFDSVEQKEATERVLAAVRIKTIEKELEELTMEMVKYATNIDTISERNSLETRYLNRLGTMVDVPLLELDEDLKDKDFRVVEVVEDLIERINTRITLIKNNEILVKELQETYKVNMETINEDIKTAKLEEEAFQA